MATTTTEKTSIKISTGNSKLADTFIWNIAPVDTCPGRTPLCEKYCYARKAYRLYTNTRKAWDTNTEYARSGEFFVLVREYLERELASKRKTSRFKYFRIHESGDFFSQAYLDDWIEIARAFPGLQFLAYTKSAWLDFTERPANFTVYFSAWSDTTERAYKFAKWQGLPVARLDDVAPTGERPTFDCKPASKCAECRVCWAGKAEIMFHKH